MLVPLTTNQGFNNLAWLMTTVLAIIDAPLLVALASQAYLLQCSPLPQPLLTLSPPILNAQGPFPPQDLCTCSALSSYFLISL